MSTSLDILLTRPLRTLETRGAKYGHKTLNKTRRTSRPYALIATVFLFTRKIILNAPRVSGFDICLLKNGSEGLAYRISRKGEAVRLPKSIGRLGPPTRYEKTKNIDSYAGYSKPRHKHQGPNPSGRSFSATHATKVTLPTPPIF